MSAQQVSYLPKFAFAPEKAATNTKGAAAKGSSRPLYLRGGVVSQAVGSATCEIGRTKVVCSVHGPRSRRQAGRGEFTDSGAVDVDATYAPFSRRFSNAAEREKAGRELSLWLESSLQCCVQLWRFPKSVVDVYVVVLEDDGSSAACAALCACFALAKSGIDMYDLGICCSIAVSGENQELIVDPDAAQEKSADALCKFGILASSSKLICFDVVSKSNLKPELLKKIHAVGLGACNELAKIVRDQLKHEAKLEE